MAFKLHSSRLQVLLRGLEGVVNSMGQTVALPVLHGMNATDPACQLLAAVQANAVISAGESTTTAALKSPFSLSASQCGPIHTAGLSACGSHGMLQGTWNKFSA